VAFRFAIQSSPGSGLHCGLLPGLFATRRWNGFAALILLLTAALAYGAESGTNGTIQFAGQSGELIVSEVSDRTLRIQFVPASADSTVRRSTVLADFSVTERLRVRELDAAREFSCGRLKVRVTPRPLTIAVTGSQGARVQELSLDEAPGTNAAVMFQVGGPVLGLGEGAQQFDRRGALYPMEPSWGGWNRPVLGSVVPSPFVIGTDGWALFAHQPEGQFDLRDDRGRVVPRLQESGGALDLFVIAVDDPSDALAEYVRLTGRPVMPPRWALGYFQSHRTLADPGEALAVARKFRESQLPCDAVIYLGTGYCTNGWNTGHGSLSFNTNAFLPEHVRALHDLNFKVVLHVNRAPRDLFGNSVKENSDSRLHIRNYWQRHQPLMALGVDGWWPDDGDELPLEARLTRHRCYYEGSLLDRPNVRPWSLHRTGYAGSQRYGGWIWSGDIDGRWETLAAQVSVGLNHGLSLTPFWGTDTGGFYPSKELTGELYVRWFQFSAFCSSFRSHGRTWHLRLPWGWNTGELGPIEHPRPQHPDLSELRNAAVEPICRKFLELRYRLLPYNYTVAREAVDTGLPMMRALWLHYPREEQAVALGNQYLWGRDLLVAPVIEKGAKSRRIYLPAGDWHDWWTGERRRGSQWVERPVDLETLPLFVRAGAIVPLDPPRQFTSQPTDAPTTLRVFPGADGTFTLYDDDGESLAYRDAGDPRALWIRMRWDDARKQLQLDRDPRMARWPGGVRRFSVEIAGQAQPKRIAFEGAPIQIQFE
jgi:alpha-glucosidase (family GH31 glycosyl hydrolase)